MPRTSEQTADAALDEFLGEHNITPEEGEYPWSTLGWELGDGGPAYESIRDLVVLALNMQSQEPAEASLEAQVATGPLNASQALQRAAEGVVTVLVRVELAELLDAARSRGDQDEHDRLHAAAFTEGVPCGASYEVKGTDPSGALYVSYSTLAEGFDME